MRLSPALAGFGIFKFTVLGFRYATPQALCYRLLRRLGWLKCHGQTRRASHQGCPDGDLACLRSQRRRTLDLGHRLRLYSTTSSAMPPRRAPSVRICGKVLINGSSSRCVSFLKHKRANTSAALIRSLKAFSQSRLNSLPI